jgi:hypothetical protein
LDLKEWHRVKKGLSQLDPMPLFDFYRRNTTVEVAFLKYYFSLAEITFRRRSIRRRHH